jgi:spore germination protein YaaH
MPLSPTERSMRSQIAAHESWARTENRTARTANARKALLDRFELQVDPDGRLTPTERAKRAEHARKAHFKRIAFLSAQARRRRAEEAAAGA